MTRYQFAVIQSHFKKGSNFVLGRTKINPFKTGHSESNSNGWQTRIAKWTKPFESKTDSNSYLNISSVDVSIAICDYNVINDRSERFTLMTKFGHE